MHETHWFFAKTILVEPVETRKRSSIGGKGNGSSTGTQEGELGTVFRTLSLTTSKIRVNAASDSCDETRAIIERFATTLTISASLTY